MNFRNCFPILFSLISMAAPAMANPVDVFVLAGQSNMQGFKGDAAKYPTNLAELDASVPFFWNTPRFSDSSDAWTTLRAQKGRFPSGHFGPEVTFGRCLVTRGVKPWIIKFSLGNTSIAEHWKGPGEGGLYDRMKETIASAINQLQNNGYTPRVRGFLWIQGESDAKKELDAEMYEERLNTLLTDFRQTIAYDENVSILLGVDEKNPDVVKNKWVLYSHQKTASEQPNVRFSSMIGLEKADFTHLTPNGVALHGERLCNDFLALEACRATSASEKCTPIKTASTLPSPFPVAQKKASVKAASSAATSKDAAPATFNFENSANTKAVPLMSSGKPVSDAEKYQKLDRNKYKSSTVLMANEDDMDQQQESMRTVDSRGEWPKNTTVITGGQSAQTKPTPRPAPPVTPKRSSGTVTILMGN